MKSPNKIASFFNALFVNRREQKSIDKVEKVIERMNPTEKIIFYLATTICIVSGLILLLRVHDSFLVEVPSFGGEFSEGIVGSPRFINPILSISETDKDLSSLLYSGLLKATENNGFVGDLAASYEVEEEGRVYHLIIKDNAYFHDGKPVTVDDVIFTVGKILDPTIKSPRRANWEGVEIEKVSNKEIKFTLSKPYEPFLETLTMGILPKHVWEKATPEEFPFNESNLNPIGSGPYKVEKVEKNSGGIPTSITLSSFQKYVSGRPKIKSITFKFFQNENDLLKAYEEKSIESLVGISPVAAKRLSMNTPIKNDVSLPRVFGVFFNQNMAPIFLNKEIREALELSAPKKRIVDEVLYGYGKILNGPTPENVESDGEKALGNIEIAKDNLVKAGWKENEDGVLTKKTSSGNTLFSFSITTSDAPELKRTAEILQETWQKLGAKVDVKIFEAGDLSQNIIRSRKYDALLFGEVVGVHSDLYPFWHSSQRTDPGLNISLYTNIKVDKMLEEIQRGKASQEENTEREDVLAEIKKDVPAVFLFSPSLLYSPAADVKNISMKNTSYQNERFLSVNNWYIETDKVWKIFAPK